jgi:hypothetical protein
MYITADRKTTHTHNRQEIIMDITKKIAQEISAEAVKALQEVAKKFNLEVTANGGIIDPNTFTAKFKFSTPLKVNPDANLTEEYLRFGLAPRGTPVICSKGERGIIVEARRSKYVVEIKGKQYTTPFTGVKLVPKETAKS